MRCSIAQRVLRMHALLWFQKQRLTSFSAAEQNGEEEEWKSCIGEPIMVEQSSAAHERSEAISQLGANYTCFLTEVGIKTVFTSGLALPFPWPFVQPQPTFIRPPPTLLVAGYVALQ